jgi:V/A-type H+-transporting ATPase subunit D
VIALTQDIIEGAKPTRMELLHIRKRRALAEKGHKLLTEKRDALIQEFFDIIEKRKSVRATAEDELALAYKDLLRARMTLGKERLRMLAHSVRNIPPISVKTENILGVRVPKIEAIPERDKAQRYSFLDSNAHLDAAAVKFESSLDDILKLAEVETRIRRLARDIEKTKRRVNALEHLFIPQLKSTEKYIEMQLEEREREDFFRRKRIKALMERQ